MLRTRTISLAAIALLAPLALGAAESSGMAACRAIADVAARAACYDRLADQSSAQPPQPAQSAQSAAPLPVQREVAVPKQARKKAPAEPTSVTSTLERVERSAAGKVVLYTADAGVWVQTDTQRVETPPRAGDPIEIRKGAFGSHFCKASKGAGLRCTEVLSEE